MAKRKKKAKGTPKSPIVAVILALCLLIFAREELFFAIEEWMEQWIPASAPAVIPGEQLSYHVIDVGQGDCTLIIRGDKTVLIDAGENGKGKIVLDYLKKLGVDHLDYVIGTHGHSDHIGGLDEVMRGVSVGTVLMPEIPEKLIPTTKTFRDFLAVAEESGAELMAVGESMILDLGGGGIVKVFPPKITPKDTNNTSLYTLTTFGKADFFSSGDAERESEQSILAVAGLSAVEVMKLGHHGSQTSNSTELLAVLQPTAVFIPVGAGNDYGHPHIEPMDRVERYTKEIARTDLDGSFYYATDGETILLVSEDSQRAIKMK